MTNSRRVRRNVIKALHDNLTSGAIHIGNVGEMVAGLLLLFSFDWGLKGPAIAATYQAIRLHRLTAT